MRQTQQHPIKRNNESSCTSPFGGIVKVIFESPPIGGRVQRMDTKFRCKKVKAEKTSNKTNPQMQPMQQGDSAESINLYPPGFSREATIVENIKHLEKEGSISNENTEKKKKNGKKPISGPWPYDSGWDLGTFGNKSDELKNKTTFSAQTKKSATISVPTTITSASGTIRKFACSTSSSSSLSSSWEDLTAHGRSCLATADRNAKVDANKGLQKRSQSLIAADFLLAGKAAVEQIMGKRAIPDDLTPTD